MNSCSHHQPKNILVIFCLSYSITKYLWVQMSVTESRHYSNGKSDYYYYYYYISWLCHIIDGFAWYYSVSLSSSNKPTAEKQVIITKFIIGPSPFQNTRTCPCSVWQQGVQAYTGKFLCNMALSPQMHSHILMIITDDQTAAAQHIFLPSVRQSQCLWIKSIIFLKHTILRSQSILSWCWPGDCCWWICLGKHWLNPKLWYG